MITIGIDLGIRKIALSTWDTTEVSSEPKSELVNSAAMEISAALTRPQQLARIGHYAVEYCWGATQGVDGNVERHVFIEEPLIGNNRSYSLQIAQTYGSVLAALAELQDGFHYQVFAANVSQWKKATVGAGNATKEQVKNYIVGIHTSYSGLCGHDQDRYDAAAIGAFGVDVALKAQALVQASQHRDSNGSST